MRSRHRRSILGSIAVLVLVLVVVVTGLVAGGPPAPDSRGAPAVSGPATTGDRPR